MRFSDDDDIISSIRRKIEVGLDAIEENDFIFREYSYLARKAQWAYQHYLLRTSDNQESVDNSFQITYLDAWCDYYYYAAAVSSGMTIEQVPFTTCNSKLFLTWHYPEYPLLLPEIRRNRALVLIAQKTDWFSYIVGEQNICLFRDPSSAARLAHAFREGRPVVAMIDYCYEETASIDIPFLSYEARTPRGLFILAKKFGYIIEIISFSDGVFKIINSLSNHQISIADIACNVNLNVERGILVDPPRWLLWPSIDRRWIGVDYGE